jgi:splicing factor 3A subunit 3
MFSGEEAYGKYCDLYVNHIAYTNLKGIDKRPAYLQYLDLLLPEEDTLVHQDLPKDTRLSRQYES